MGSPRTAEDHLRSEYARLLPVMQRVLTAIDTEVRHALLVPILSLLPHERILVRTRIKDCESAVDALKRRQRFAKFDPDRPPDQYSLTTLPDLVGVRILTFPRRRLEEVRQTLAPRLRGWRADPVYGNSPDGEPIALKFDGRWRTDDPFSCEIQITSLLVGLFWEVEHWAIYKPTPNLRAAAKRSAMHEKADAVLNALNAFELQFEHEIESADHSFPTDNDR